MTLTLSTAYPGSLGQPTPTPPPGYVFLVVSKQSPEQAPAPSYGDYYGYDEFEFLTDDSGALLLVEAT